MYMLFCFVNQVDTPGTNAIIKEQTRLTKGFIIQIHISINIYMYMLFCFVNQVDTPGTNAIIKEQTRLTKGFIPQSDLVIFVTSAERPVTETEGKV